MKFILVFDKLAAFSLICCMFFVVDVRSCHAQDELPDIDSLFRDVQAPIPNEERPKTTDLQLAASLGELVVPATVDELQELSSWVRWLVLRNLPPSYEDNRKWGLHKEVFDGIRFRREGLKLETKRKKKSVKQGTWSRYYIEFIEPQERLEISVQTLEYPRPGVIRVETQIVAPLKLFGRVSQWQRDVQLISLSTNATAVVEMNVTCDIQVIMNPLKIPPDVEFRPDVTAAKVQLRSLDVERISQLHGPMVDLLGKGIRDTLDQKLAEYDEKLEIKMNQEIAKQQSKLKLSVQDWLQTSVQKKSK